MQGLSKDQNLPYHYKNEIPLSPSTLIFLRSAGDTRVTQDQHTENLYSSII